MSQGTWEHWQDSGESASSAPRDSSSRPHGRPHLRIRTRARTTTPPLARPARGVEWICGYLIFVFICQLLLLVPALSPVRVVLRTAAFGASLALVALLPAKPDRLHPAIWAAGAVLGIVGIGLFHPLTNTLLSGLAELMMYAAILAPLLWVAGVQVTGQGFARMVFVLWGFHTVSALMGVLQVYFPGKLEPSLSSVIIAQGDWYVEDLKITLANGMRTFRPMGLSDTPGGAAGSGFYAVLLGAALLVWEKKWWMKPAFIASMLGGMFCLYLSQVRVMLVMTAICLLVFMGLMALRGQIGKVLGLLLVVVILVLASFSWAVAVGGNAATKRLSQLVASDPGKVYYSNRGHFLEDTVTILVPEFPLGAGLGRWGMMNYYFGDNSDPNRAMIWAEIMWTGWVLDGGIPLVLAYVFAIGVAFWWAARIALDRKHPDLGVWGALVFAYNAGALAVTFNSPLFLSQGGLEFWLLNAALFGAWITSRQAEQTPALASAPDTVSAASPSPRPLHHPRLPRLTRPLLSLASGTPGQGTAGALEIKKGSLPNSPPACREGGNQTIAHQDDAPKPGDLPLKPYLLVSGDFSRRGGMDRANHALASFLAEQAREVHLVAHHVDADLAAHPNVTWHRVPRPLGSCFLGEPLLDRVGRHHAARLAQRGAVVVVNGGNCCWADVNWVHYVHAAWPAAGWKHRLYRRAERRALSHARLVIANSQRTRADLIERLGLDPRRVRTVYLGTDAQAFHPATPQQRSATRARLGCPQDSTLVAFVGALGDRRKGFDTLFEAWKRLASPGPWNAKLLVIGAGAELALWKERAAAARLTGIHFLGFREDVPTLLQACDVLVAPSRYEPYGLGVQEALCCGLPALVSARAGVAEHYPASLKDLLIDNPADARELVRRLRHWSEHREDYRNRAATLGDQLRAHAWNDTARRMVDLMESPQDAQSPQSGRTGHPIRARSQMESGRSPGNEAC